MKHRHKGSDWDLYVLVALLLLALYLASCAAREPSSTDHHYIVPSVDCGLVERDGSMHKVCCQGVHCVYVW